MRQVENALKHYFRRCPDRLSQLHKRKSIISEKRKRSDSALWQKPSHRQKNPKSNVTTQRTPPKTSITQRLRTDLGRSAWVTIATRLVWLNRFTGSQPPRGSFVSLVRSTTMERVPICYSVSNSTGSRQNEI